MCNRGRPKGSCSKYMQEKKLKALSLIEINPFLSMQRVADHVGVSVQTIGRWFDERGLKR